MWVSVVRLLCSLLLLASAAAAQVQLKVGGQVITPRFTGVGFHAEFFMTSITPEFFDQVVAKRWKELNPGFARVFHRWAPGPVAARDQAALDGFLKQFLFFKQATGTEVYFTTGGPKDTQPGPEREAYARAVVDELEYLLQGGATNITTYCMSNELSMGTWAAMVKDLDKFKDYHRLIHAEIQRRGLKLDLLATDASPISYWNTIEWAAANMDSITEVYGGHHYANQHPPEDLAFYDWFREKVAWAVSIARSKGKEFILGEFGPAQFIQNKYGVRWDTCRYYGTPREPLAGLQLSEAVLAAINGGARAMGYWTFMDYPDDERSKRINQWGLFKWLKNGGELRTMYYPYGLLTKFFRGPGQILEISTSDPKIRAAAIRHEKGTWSLAVINRNENPTSIAVSLPGNPASAWRKYEYVVAAPPKTEDGDLPGPVAVVKSLRDTVKPLSLSIYTTAYEDEPPESVSELKAQRFFDDRLPGATVWAQRLTWKASTSRDVIYYRVFYGDERAGSTATTEFLDEDAHRPAGRKWRVVAVDSSGNVSTPVECERGQ